MKLEQAKEWARLGFVIIIVAAGIGKWFGDINTYSAYEWRSAMNKEQTFFFEGGDSYKISSKTKAEYYYKNDCLKPWEQYGGESSLDSKVCLTERKNERVAFERKLRVATNEKKESFKNTLVDNRAEYEKNSADKDYVVWEIKQIALNAGLKVSDIKSPVTTKENIGLWME
ncbi:hypothetical protein ACU63M_21930 [Klebsiella aerogenes]